jgi:hypothetical protein
MRWIRFTRFRRWIACGIVLVAAAGVSRADEAELRALIEKQNKEIEELKQQMQQRLAQPVTPAAAEAAADGKKPLDDGAVKKIVADYLKDNPGAGMPSGVQTGYDPATGFAIRSAPAPTYTNWADESKIPFELRFRGRMQFDYYGYKVTDHLNHLTLAPQDPPVGDFSQLEIKRLRLIWEGTAFDPNLRYHFELDGNTRGLGGTLNNRQIGNNDPGAAPNGAPGIGFAGGAAGTGVTANNVTGGGVTVDHAVRLFSAYIAYDFHGCESQTGCGPDCPEGSYKYAPTYTLIAGKAKPFFCLEEYCGSANEQMVEYSMADWFFDADDDNLLMMAGIQVKAMDDRLYAMAVMTNGNESQFPNTQMDRLPGFNAGFWYDFGGTWNEQRHRWDLWGDGLADVDYSCNPVFRVGGAVDLVPMDRRSIYGDDEQSRVFVLPGAPGGTRLINLLNGGTGATSNLHAIDKFDSYTLDVWASGKYKGFSLENEWWVRDLTDFKTVPAGGNVIEYTADGKSAGANLIFPGHDLIDFGTQIQAGYFVVPKKAEIVARFSIIEGQSGDVGGPAHGISAASAFSHYHAAYEYAGGFNYYFHRQLLKWQTDISYYQGGNPDGTASSPAGFLAGADGWMLRTQIQLAF